MLVIKTLASTASFCQPSSLAQAAQWALSAAAQAKVDGFFQPRAAKRQRAMPARCLASPVPLRDRKRLRSELLLPPEPFAVPAAMATFEAWTQQYGEAACAEAIGRLLRTGNAHVRYTTVAAIGALAARGRPGPDCFELLQPLLQDSFAPVRCLALATMGFTAKQSPTRQQLLRDCAHAPEADIWLRRAGATALARAQDLLGLAQLLQDREPWVRREAVGALACGADFVSLACFKDLVNDPCTWVRLRLVEVLSCPQWLAQGATETLFNIARQDPSSMVRHSAARRVAHAWGSQTARTLMVGEDHTLPFSSGDMLDLFGLAARQQGVEHARGSWWSEMQRDIRQCQAILGHGTQARTIVDMAKVARKPNRFQLFIGPLTNVVMANTILLELSHGRLGEKDYHTADEAKTLLCMGLVREWVPEGDRLALTHFLLEHHPEAADRLAAVISRDRKLLGAMATRLESATSALATPAGLHALGDACLLKHLDTPDRDHITVRLLAQAGAAAWGPLSVLLNDQAGHSPWQATFTAGLARANMQAFVANARLDDPVQFAILRGMAHREAGTVQALAARLGGDPKRLGSKARGINISERVLQTTRLSRFPQVRHAVAFLLGEKEGTQSQQMLETLAQDSHPQVADRAIASLGEHEMLRLRRKYGRPIPSRRERLDSNQEWRG